VWFNREEDVEDVLYIVGNGFDIYHGLASRFSDFKEYLSIVDRDLRELIEEFIPVDESWSDLESALADIEVDHLIENASQFLVPYGAEDWSDAYHHDFQYEVNRMVESLSRRLGLRLLEWVRQIQIPALEDLHTRPLRFHPSGRFLTFNYTSTLTDTYNIPGSQVLHIHGSASDGAELVLGHAWDPLEIQPTADLVDEESSDVRVREGYEIANGYFGQTYKDSKRIISKHGEFFQSIKGVTNIFVMGHSLSRVDHAYFQKIVASVEVERVRWTVTHFGDEERERHRLTLRLLGIPDSKVFFCTMDEL